MKIPDTEDSAFEELAEAQTRRDPIERYFDLVILFFVLLPLWLIGLPIIRLGERTGFGPWLRRTLGTSRETKKEDA